MQVFSLKCVPLTSGLCSRTELRFFEILLEIFIRELFHKILASISRFLYLYGNEKIGSGSNLQCRFIAAKFFDFFEEKNEFLSFAL